MKVGFVGVTRSRVRAVLHYAARRPLASAEFMRSMIDQPGSGSSALTEAERRDALRTDSTLRRLGVRCLWRSAIVTEQLRRRGVAASVGITVSTSDPRLAHAECEVGGVPLRRYASDSVRLR